MDVLLSPELETFVHSEIESGRYASVSDVVRDALRLLEEGRRLTSLAPDDVRSKIAEAAASLQRGEAADGEEAIARLNATIDAIERSQKTG